MDSYKEIFELANECYKNKNYNVALELYEQCIRISDNKDVSTISMYNMATTYIKLKDFDNAISHFKKVIKVKDYYNAAAAFFNLGYCYTMTEEYYLAYKSFKKSRELNQSDEDTTKAMNLIKDKLTN